MTSPDLICVGNAIVDILSNVSFETLDKLDVPKGSMQLVDEKQSDKILKYIQFINLIILIILKNYLLKRY